MAVQAIKSSGVKVAGVTGFYLRKVIAVVDSVIDNTVKACEAILNKVPKIIDDGYTLIVQNITIKNFIIVVLLNILYNNSKLIMGNLYLLAVILGAIAIIEGSIRVR